MLDEPSLGLAPIMVEFIFATIFELRKCGRNDLARSSKTSRNRLQLAEFATVLENGEVALSGSAADIADNDAYGRLISACRDYGLSRHRAWLKISRPRTMKNDAPRSSAPDLPA